MAQIGIPDNTDEAIAIQQATFITSSAQATLLPNSRRLVAGTGIQFVTTTPGQWRIDCTVTPGSGGGEPDTDDQTADEVPYPRNGQTTAGGALDNIYTTLSGTPLTAIERQYVLRDGVNGIVAGVVDDAQAAINLAAINALIVQCVTENCKLKVDGDTFHIFGGPIFVPVNAFGFRWEGLLNTAIVQRSDNTAIFQLGEVGAGSGNILIGAILDGCSLFYLNDQAGNGTATTIGATMLVIGNTWFCTVRNWRNCNTTSPNRPYRCMYIQQGVTAFSNRYENVKNFQGHQTLFQASNFATGNAYTNIYNSGVGPSGTSQSVAAPIVFEMASGAQTHDSVLNQFNVEWCNSNKLFRFANIRGLVINSPHIEQCRLSGLDPCIVSNLISNVTFNGGCILDVYITTALVTVSAGGGPSVVRPFNNGVMVWNGFIWVNNLTSYINMPFMLHYQANSEGLTTNTGRTTFVQPEFVNGSGAVLRDNLKVDSLLGGTDKDGGVWGNLFMRGAARIECGGAMTRVYEPVITLDSTRQLYGAACIDATFIVPSNITAGNIVVTLPRYMGPPGSRWGTTPVYPGLVLRATRGGTTVNQITFNNWDGAAVSTIATGQPTSQRYFYVDSTGNWALASSLP